MSNPLRQPMPRGMDIRIRLRLLRAWVGDHMVISLGALMVPALAAWLFVVGVGTDAPSVPQFDEAAMVASIKEAQAAELARAEGGIYHVTREISEGGGKTAYVQEVIGASEVAEQRVDVIDTYQHSDTALALIESNGTEQPFEVFLSREHDDGALSLHHYGPGLKLISKDRDPYDEAHDLASLYTAYTSLERPAIPVLAAEAEYVDMDTEANRARFRTVVNDVITIDSYVDLDSKQVVEDIIYVKGNETEYEMTRVTYLEREVLPAERFEEVFDPEQFEYEMIDMKEVV